MDRYRSEQSLEAFAALQEELDPAERTAETILIKNTLPAVSGGNKVSPALSAQALVEMPSPTLLVQCQSANDPNKTFQDPLDAGRD